MNQGIINHGNVFYGSILEKDIDSFIIRII